jgi:hypothetical protein
MPLAFSFCPVAQLLIKEAIQWVSRQYLPILNNFCFWLLEIYCHSLLIALAHNASLSELMMVCWVSKHFQASTIPSSGNSTEHPIF